MLRPENAYSALQLVERAGPRGITIEHFTRDYWPGNKLAVSGRVVKGALRNGGGAGVLAALAREGYATRLGEGRNSLYRLTADGRAFLDGYGQEAPPLAYIVGDELEPAPEDFGLEPGCSE